MHICFLLIKRYPDTPRTASRRQRAPFPGLGARHEGSAVRTTGWYGRGRYGENEFELNPIFHYKLNI